MYFDDRFIICGMLKFMAVLPLLLLGCSDDVPKPAKTSRVDRQAKAELQLSKTPLPRTYIIQGSQLQVLNVPVADSRGYVEMQRCYVWRDVEFKTASMQCPSESNDAPPPSGGPTEEKPYP